MPFFFFLRGVITNTGALGTDEDRVPRAHSIRPMVTSLTFSGIWSLPKALEAATWRLSILFSSFYLREVAQVLGDLWSLGPLMWSGQVLNFENRGLSSPVSDGYCLFSGCCTYVFGLVL